MGPFVRHLQRATNDVDRLRGRLEDNQKDVEDRFLDPGERAQAGLEVGEDDAMFRFELPEQLLR